MLRDMLSPHEFAENPRRDLTVETTQQLYPCKLMQCVVVVTRTHAPRRLTGGDTRPHRELVFEQCSEAASCPKARQCPL
jgi:hypothetical protein